MDRTWTFVRKWQGLALFVGVSLIVGSMFLAPHGARGQGLSTASVTGTVQDPSGAVIPGAQVVITQTDTGFSRTIGIGGDGIFTFPVLPVGPYQLEVQKQGFSTYKQTGIVLTVSQAAQLTVTLRPGTVTQNIEVKATASPVDTTTGTLSQLVDRQQVVELPLNGRDPAELALLGAGVSNFSLSSNVLPLTTAFAYPESVGGSSLSPGALGPVVNGLRPGSVYFSLDGASNMDPFMVTGGPFPNPDAVQEFRMVTSGKGAEYVSAPGGAVNIVTRSGTNAFHGDLFEFLRNGALNARNFFAAKSDNIRRNQFGGTAGGPIQKDKFFVFGSYQGTTLASSVGGNIVFVPTVAERNGDFSSTSTQLKNPNTGLPFMGNQIPIADFDPVIDNVLPHMPQSPAANGELELVNPTHQSEHQGTMKVDYLLGARRR